MAPLGWVQGAPRALQTGLRAAPEGLQRERAPADQLCSSDAPQVRPRPSARSRCLCFHWPVLLRRFPPRHPPPQRPAHLLSPPLFSAPPAGAGHPPPQVQLCWLRPVSQQSGSAVPRRPALPQAAGCVPCGLLPSLANEGPSMQVHPTGPSSGDLVAPAPQLPAPQLSLVFWGAHPPPALLTCRRPSPCSAQLGGAASGGGPRLSAHQGAPPHWGCPCSGPCGST